MVDKKAKGRVYTSVLRRQQKEITRDLILDSVAQLISEGRILDFSIKEVADKAGVSYGSVYRHFPTKESLLEALYEKASEIMAQSAPFAPQSLEEIPNMMRKTVALFEENEATVLAFTKALMVNNVQPQERYQRDQKIQELVMESSSFLTSVEAKQITAIISHLNSSLTWAVLRERFGLNFEESASALNWVLQTLIQDLIRRKED